MAKRLSEMAQDKPVGGARDKRDEKRKARKDKVKAKAEAEGASPKRIAVLLSIGIACLAAALVFASARIGSIMSETARADASLEEAKSLLALAQSEADEHAAQLARDSSGISEGRMGEGTERIRSLCELLFSWTSGEEYRANREAIEDDFAIPEDSTLLREVMVPLPIKDEESEEASDVVDEAHLHSELVDVKPFVMDVGPDFYDYFCLVTYRTSNVAGAESEGMAAVQATVTFDGAVSNVTVDALPQGFGTLF